MKLKRLLASMLAFCMILSTMGTVAFAEDATVATVNGTAYTDLQEAIKAAAPNGTVEITNDVTIEKWVMFAQNLSIGTGQLITLDMDGLTIDGKGHSVTIKSIESASNGSHLFSGAKNLNIKDLTFNQPEGLGGISLVSGEINNVTFNGGSGIFPGEGNIVIDGCTFKTDTYCIYHETARENLAVTNNTFEIESDDSVIFLRGNETFTGNTVTSGGKVRVVSGTPTVSGNTFSENVILKVYNAAEATIEKNDIANIEIEDVNAEVNSTFADNTLSADAEQALKDAGVLPDGGSSDEETVVATVNGEEYVSLQTALDAAAAAAGEVTVEVLADIDLTDVDWNPVTVSAPKYPVVTVNGNNKTITGLNDMLFAGTWAGGSGLIITDLTIKDSNIVNDENDSKGNVGVGAFIGFPQASATVTLNNCHLVGSTVSGGHWTGGLIGYAAGYAGDDGPVFMNLTITGCSVTGSTITGKGSAGGVIGHGSGNGWTNVVIENTTVSNNTITSTGSSTNKAGAVMGTIGAAGQPTTANGVTKTGGASIDATVSGNNVTSAGTTITTIYGRQGTATGMLCVTGGTYEYYPIEEGVSYAAPADGFTIEQNKDGTYGVFVEKKNYAAEADGAKYETIAEAIKNAENEVIIYAGDYTGGLTVNKAITVKGETDAEGKNLVNISGKLSITADGAIVKNVNINNGSDTAGYIDAKDVVIEGCSVVGGNGFRWCYTDGVTTFKDCTITGTTYGIHFDGNCDGKVQIENCVITGWTSFASTITKVTISDSEFAEGNYNQLRFYQDSEITDTEFNPDMNVDFGVDEVECVIKNCTVTDGSPITDVIYLGDIAEMGVKVTVDDAPVQVAASVTSGEDTVYYLTLEAAFAAAKTGDTITIKPGTYAVPAMKAGITVVGEGEVLLEGTLSGTLENLTLKNLHIKSANAQRWAYAKGDCVFENVTFEATSVYALHFDGITSGANLLYKNCTIIGWAAMSGSPASVVFDGCTIKDNGKYGLIRTYFDAEIKNCTFDVDGANTEDVYQEGIHATAGAEIKVDNCINANGDMKDILNTSGNSKVYLDGELVLYPVATVGETYYNSLQKAIDAAKDGETVVIIAEGTYTLPSVDKKITIEGYDKEKVVFDFVGKAYNALAGVTDITFKNVTINKTGAGYSGFFHSSKEAYDNCIINGEWWTYATDAVFTECVFNQTSNGAYNLWTYGSSRVTLDRCTLNSAGKSVLLYNEGAVTATELTVIDTDFIASEAVSGKAAIEIDTSLMSGTSKVSIDNLTTATGFAGGNVSGNTLWNDKKNKTNIEVTVNDVQVWPLPAVSPSITRFYLQRYENGTAAIYVDISNVDPSDGIKAEVYSDISKSDQYNGDVEAYAEQVGITVNQRICTTEFNQEKRGDLKAGTLDTLSVYIPIGGTDEYWNTVWDDNGKYLTEAYMPTNVVVTIGGETYALDEFTVLDVPYYSEYGPVTHRHWDAVQGVADVALPTATVTDLENEDLTFALSFTADDPTNDQLRKYWDWYADFELVVSGDVTFNANGGADGYLSGQYQEAFGDTWLNVPFDDVEVTANNSFRVMDYADSIFPNHGLKFRYYQIYAIVKTFNCGVFFEEDFMAANPDFEVGLALKMYDNGDKDGDVEGYAVGSVYEFEFEKPVAKIGETEYATLQEAIDAAQDDDTITIIADIEMTSPVVISGKTLTLDLGGYTISDKNTRVLTDGDKTWGLIALKDNANLTVCGNGTIDCNYAKSGTGWTGMAYCFDVDTTSELTVNSGTFTNGNGGIQTAGKVTVNNGTFVSHNGGTCIMATGSDANVAVNDGTFKDSIEDDDVYTGSGAVWSGFGATVNINGGTYDFAADPEHNNIVWTLFPAQNAIVGYGENANMAVSGGTFANFNPATDVVLDWSASNGFTFGSVVADGYEVQDNGDGTYDVVAALEEDSFLDKLLVIWDMAIKTDENGTKYYPIHVYAGIDSLQYKEVGFKVTAKNTQTGEVTTLPPLDTNVVYRSMKVTDFGGNVTLYRANELGSTCTHMFGKEILFTAGKWTNANTEIQITPYAIDLNGKEITGETKVITDDVVQAIKPNTPLFKEGQ